MKKFTNTHLLREALVELMEKQKFSQAEVGQKVGVAQSVISLFISGRRGLSGDSALRIQDFILTETLPPTTPSTTQQEDHSS